MYDSVSINDPYNYSNISPIAKLVTSTYAKIHDAGDIEYLHSSNRAAYPDSGIVDGYEYEYLGVPLENAVGAPKIATGSYVGNGTYGANSPCSLTFDFVPKLWGIYASSYTSGQISSNVTDDGYLHTMVQLPWGIEINDLHVIKYSGSTVTWYYGKSTSGASNQGNASGYSYYYWAVG